MQSRTLPFQYSREDKKTTAFQMANQRPFHSLQILLIDVGHHHIEPFPNVPDPSLSHLDDIKETISLHIFPCIPDGRTVNIQTPNLPSP